MKLNNIYKGVIGIGLISSTFISCQSKLDTVNENVVSPETYFKNTGELVLATNAIYGTLRSPALVGREWFFVHDLKSDDVVAGGGQLEAPRRQILQGSADPTNPLVGSMWNALYVMIHRANTVIENSAKLTEASPLKDRSVGEAKFLRAWAYYELVSMWGGVPMYLSTVKSPSDSKPRSKDDEVYAQIIKDLQEAATLLPQKGATDKGRATNGAANALLGRVLMQKGDYAGAKAALLKVTGYTLTDRFLDNFEEEGEFNSESIFEVVFFDKGDNNFNWGGYNTGDGVASPLSTVRNQEYNPIAWRNLIPSDKVLNEFEKVSTGSLKDDPRYSYSVYQTGDKYNNGNSTLVDGDQNGNASVVNGTTIKVGWRKFMIIYKEDKAKAGFHPAGNNQRLLRYAEVLINLAECENELGNPAAAVAYLNQVRSRPSVAMPPYPTVAFPAITKDQVTKAIMHEKSVEMASEEVRNIDILRWRKKGYFAGAEPIPAFKVGKDELLPIPQAEVDNNPKLGEGGVPKQNPGF